LKAPGFSTLETYKVKNWSSIFAFECVNVYCYGEALAATRAAAVRKQDAITRAEAAAAEAAKLRAGTTSATAESDATVGLYKFNSFTP
jgi:hypothetical protein